MRYYDENTNKVVTEKFIAKAVAPSNLPKPLRPIHVSSRGFKPYFATQPPETTSLQVASKTGYKNVDGKYTDTWEVKDRFADITDGLTKEEQEQEYLDMISAQEEAIVIVEENKVNLQTDEVLNLLKTKTYAQVSTWIDSNTTFTETEKKLVKGLTKAVMHLIKKELD